MPSRADRIRLERVLLGASFALLAFCLWAMLRPPVTRYQLPVAGSELAGHLNRWTRERPADSLTLSLTTAPGAVQRDWLRALAGTGTVVSWSGAVPATAVEVVPVSDPAGGVRVLAAAPAASWARLADGLGTLDSARVARAGAAFTLAAHQEPLVLGAGGQLARAAEADSLAPRHVALLGSADWESRFVIAALEERGWTVDARLSVAPQIATTAGQVFPLDTARQSVVVVLDSLGGSDAAAVQRFALNGGGVVLSARGARGLPSLAAGAVGPHVRAPVVAFAAATPRRALALDPVLPRADAVVLERAEGSGVGGQGSVARAAAPVVLAARRVGAGRVVQVGYDETWRWRMADVPGAVDAHRAWWAGVVAAAAYRPSARRSAMTAANGAADAAPLAALVATLGPPRPAAPGGAAGPDLAALLTPAAILLFACLLAEWASRRLRGAA